MSTTTPASIHGVILEVADLAASQQFHTAFGLDDVIAFRASDAPTTGFRGFTLSLVVAQPADADLLLDAAVDAGATVLKPARTSLWGYGGVVQAPDGTIWKVATSAKKNTRPASRAVDQVVLLLGVADVAATRDFYVEHGFAVAKSFGRKYVEFEASGAVKLGLYARRGLAKDAGVAPEGTGSHRVVVVGDEGFTDPDGFVWQSAARGEARDEARDEAWALRPGGTAAG